MNIFQKLILSFFLFFIKLISCNFEESEINDKLEKSYITCGSSLRIQNPLTKFQ